MPGDSKPSSGERSLNLPPPTSLVGRQFDASILAEITHLEDPRNFGWFRGSGSRGLRRTVRRHCESPSPIELGPLERYCC
jgi:hypothetical protein